MSHTVGGDYKPCIPHGISNIGCTWHHLEHIHCQHVQSTKQEMCKQGVNLRRDVITEDKRSDVGEWNNSQGVEHEEESRILNLQSEQLVEDQDENDWHIGSQDVTDHIGGPVATHGHTTDKLLVLELILALIQDKVDDNAGDQRQSNGQQKDVV